MLKLSISLHNVFESTLTTVVVPAIPSFSGIHKVRKFY
jgi:hypothetical protein